MGNFGAGRQRRFHVCGRPHRFCAKVIIRFSAAANSRTASIGTTIVLRRPTTSSVILRNRPRWFSFRSMKNSLRPVATFSVVSIVAYLLGDGTVVIGFSFGK